MSETETASSSSDPPTVSENLEKKDESDEPEAKKIKISDFPGKNDKLEQRLGGILCCAVCLDLPVAAVYQCSNGHLMCAGCFTHLLADARLRDELATCPTCRVEFSKQSASRNLAVEKAVSELPSECQFCNKEFPRNVLGRHEDSECEERITTCKYSRIGCPWRGPSLWCVEHEKVCLHPKKTGAEVMEALQIIEKKTEEEKHLYESIFDLLSFEKMTFNDLQMKPYRTDEFVHKLLYETSRFSAFGHVWVVKARINNFQSDPANSSVRDMTYQLIVKSKPTLPMTIHYLVVKGPFGDMKVKPRIYKFDFTEKECESPYNQLPLPDSTECNRLLASKAINFRMIMFLVLK
ncbi:UNVERIFIED_CONTAM: hypothetical protein PYX00_000693 [Menopon gallinae]|uniref:RING-type domain-containing protein n=1 Tax=Menopon gallinae TaxID=328185 RepID=A0AAW2IC53_9NEOP